MTVVVARLLDPREFGQFALALLLVNVFDYVKDLGVGAALVQSERPWQRIVPTGLALSVVFGLATGVVVAVAAPALARLLGHPELTDLVRVLAIAVAVSALSAVPMARLRRLLRFRERIVPEFVGAVVKVALTVGLAVAGHGVWSLVYGQLAGVIVTTALYWRAAPDVGRPGFDRAEAGRLLRFGIPVSVLTVLAFAIYNVDYLAIGTRSGTEELGLYTLAYRIPELLVLNLCIVVSEVLFSSLSRLQGDRARLAGHYRQALELVMAATAPIGIGLATLSGPLTAAMFGARYAGAAPMMTILALYTVVYSASFHAGDVYKAVGRAGLLTAMNATKLAVMVGPVWWAAGHGAVLVAAVLLGVELANLVFRLAMVHRMLPLTWPELCSAVGRPVAAAVPMGLAVLGVDAAIGALAAPVRLLVAVPVGASIYLLALRLTAPRLLATATRTLGGRMIRPTRQENPT